MPKQLSRPTVVAGIIALLQLLRIGWLAHLPTALLVQHIPDDAFYYLVLAKHFAAHGHWSFDGVAPSSGFHLLWGYLLAAGFFLLGALPFHAVFVLCSLFATVLVSLAAYLFATTAERLLGRHASWGVLLVFCSGIALVQATWLMESPLVMLAAATCIAQVSFTRERSRRAALLGGVAGCLGSLSRSDFGLLPFFLLLAAMLASDLPWRRWVAGAQLLGAGTGVAVVTLHTYLVSGHLSQASAQVKLWWAHLQGPQRLPVEQLAAAAYNPLYNLHPLGAALLRSDVLGLKVREVYLASVVLVALLWCWRQPWRRRTFASLLLPAMLCCAIAYGVVYNLDGGLQDWYMVSFLPALCLLTGAAAAALPRPTRRVAAASAVCFISVAVPLSLRAHAPWQEATYQSGLLLRQHPEWQPVGSWNAGVMSYFSQGTVVNLDGLVNDDLLPYIRTGTLAQYLDRRHVFYLIESPNIFTGVLAQRSGLEDGKAAACIDSHTVLFPNDRYDNAYGMHLQLIHLAPACVHSAGQSER